MKEIVGYMYLFTKRKVMQGVLGKITDLKEDEVVDLDMLLSCLL